MAVNLATTTNPLPEFFHVPPNYKSTWHSISLLPKVLQPCRFVFYAFVGAFSWHGTQVDDSGKVQRLRKTCPAPECGPGIFMATHFNRVYW